MKSNMSTSSTATTAIPVPFSGPSTGPVLQTQQINAVAGLCHRKPDTLDKTVTFLAKRDGIDKVWNETSAKDYFGRPKFCDILGQ